VRDRQSDEGETAFSAAVSPHFGFPENLEARRCEQGEGVIMEKGDHIQIDLAKDEVLVYGVVTKVDDLGLPQEMIEVGSVHRVWGHSAAQKGKIHELTNEHNPRPYKGSYSHIIRQYIISQHTGGGSDAVAREAAS
jgi:hypothetical protein